MTSPARRPLAPSVWLRCGLYGLALGLVPGTVATASGWLVPHDTRLLRMFGASAVAGMGVALGVAWALRNATPRPWLRALDVLALNLLLALGLGEVALRAMQRLAPSRLLWDDSSVARSVIDRRRCEPGLWFRYRCNERGYPDEEFAPVGPDDYAVALLADSFGVGSVPWSHLFTTLAEQELRARLGPRYARVAIDSHAVIGINLLGYRWIYDREIRGRGYRQVVLGFFVGNDMERPSEEGRWRRLVRLQGWLPVEVTRRLWLTFRGVERARISAEAELPERPDFLDAPGREPPYFTEGAYLQVEASRALVTVEGLGYTEGQYAAALRELDAWHAELGDRLLVVVIPDEFQVNDALWRRVLAVSAKTYSLSPEAYQRELPQRRIARWAAARGARVLDFLPALREAERSGRTYHLRDSHWNAHGNRVAGRELARALAAGEAAGR